MDTDENEQGKCTVNEDYNVFPTHAATQAGTKPLIGYVPQGQTLRLLDLLDVPHNKFLSPINFKLQKIVADFGAQYIDIYTTSMSTLGRRGSASLCRVERKNKMAATYNVLAFKR